MSSLDEYLQAAFNRAVAHIPQFPYIGGQELLTDAEARVMERQLEQRYRQELLRLLVEERTKNELLIDRLQSITSLLERTGRMDRIFSTEQHSSSVPKQEVKHLLDQESSEVVIPPPAPERKLKKQEESESEEYEEDQAFEIESDEPKRRRKNRCDGVRKVESKNIPKNFGKAIANFIEVNEPLTRRVLATFPGIDYGPFMHDIKKRRKTFNSITDLLLMWSSTENKFAAPARCLSMLFLRKHSLPYLFQYRFENMKGHVKYHGKLIRALRYPEEFRHKLSF